MDENRCKKGIGKKEEQKKRIDGEIEGGRERVDAQRGKRT